MTILPSIGFFLMDVYYLRLERKYRILYERVRLRKVPADYSMSVAQIDEPSCSRIHAFASNSILLFYGPLFMAYLLLIVFKVFVR